MKMKKTRTTVLSQSCIDELENFPTNNLITESDFSKIDRLSRLKKAVIASSKQKLWEAAWT